jgi:hypothetical protein
VVVEDEVELVVCATYTKVVDDDLATTGADVVPSKNWPGTSLLADKVGAAETVDDEWLG